VAVFPHAPAEAKLAAQRNVQLSTVDEAVHEADSPTGVQDLFFFLWLPATQRIAR
jgi:hypothetical protein